MQQVKKRSSDAKTTMKADSNDNSPNNDCITTRTRKNDDVIVSALNSTGYYNVNRMMTARNLTRMMMTQPNDD